MRLPRTFMIVAAVGVAAFVAACGGDDGGDDVDSSTGAQGASAATPVVTADGDAPGGSGASASDAVELVDVCAMITQAEVESIVGQPVGPATPEDEEDYTSFGIGGGGCRFEAEGVTPVVTVSVLAWADEAEGESAFSLLEGQYDPVDGLGDSAYRTQPIDEISVLAGRYELSVGLYFVDEDDDAEFEMARRIAELVLPHLE